MLTEKQIRREVKRLNKLQARVEPNTPEWLSLMLVREALWYALDENDSIAAEVEHRLKLKGAGN